MKRTQLKYGAIVFFVGIAIVFLFISDAFATQAQILREIKKIEQIQEVEPQEKIVRPAVEYDADEFRDPFREPSLKEDARAAKAGASTPGRGPGPALNIEGIIWGGRFPQAIINSKVVKIGDLIEGALIVDISKEGVSVFFEGEQYNLKPPAAAGAFSQSPGG